LLPHRVVTHDIWKCGNHRAGLAFLVMWVIAALIGFLGYRLIAIAIALSEMNSYLGAILNQLQDIRDHVVPEEE
jgi:hypothetical protein